MNASEIAGGAPVVDGLSVDALMASVDDVAKEMHIQMGGSLSDVIPVEEGREVLGPRGPVRVWHAATFEAQPAWRAWRPIALRSLQAAVRHRQAPGNHLHPLGAS